MVAREAEGREAAPTAVVVDSQSVKATEAGGPRGFARGREDQRPQASDRRRYARTADRIPDRPRDALAPLLRDVRHKSPFVTMYFVDSGYNGDEAQRAVFKASRIRCRQKNR